MAHYQVTTSNLKAKWREDALCEKVIQEKPEMGTAWVNENDKEFTEDARTICGLCKVETQCLNDALADGGAYGMRAGFFFDNGAVTKKDQRTLAAKFGVKSVRRNKSRVSA